MSRIYSHAVSDYIAHSHAVSDYVTYSQALSDYITYSHAVRNYISLFTTCRSRPFIRQVSVLEQNPPHYKVVSSK